MKSIVKSRWCYLIMILSWLWIMWTRTFMSVVTGETDTFSWLILGISLLTVVGTVFFGTLFWVLFEDSSLLKEEPTERMSADNICEQDDEQEDDDTEESTTGSPGAGLTYSLYIVLALAVVCLLSVVTAKWGGRLDFFDDKTCVTILGFEIEKQLIFSLIISGVFPVWSTFLIRQVKANRFSTESIVSASMQILLLSVIGLALFMHLSNFLLILMALMNVLTLAVAVRIYAWEDIRRKGNAAALILAYALVWVLFLAMFYQNGQTVAEFLAGPRYCDASNPQSFVSNLNKILSNALPVGMAGKILTEDPFVLDFMTKFRCMLLTILFYEGWAGAVAAVIPQVLFSASLFAVCQRERRKNGLDVMMMITWAYLMIKMCCGIQHLFGIPVPMQLPFGGEVSVMGDSVAFGLVLLGVVGRKAGKRLDQLVDFILPDEDEPEEEEDGEESEC